jgi:phage tail-like protein
MPPRDPYRNYKFVVEIGDFERVGFSKVTGLNMKQGKIEYREGGENDRMRKLPGMANFDDVTFERGMMDDEDMITWVQTMYDVNVERGTPDEGHRKNVTVYLLDRAKNKKRKWVLHEAWPTERNITDLDATDNPGSVLVESMVLTCEGIDEEKIA